MVEETPFFLQLILSKIWKCIKQVLVSSRKIIQWFSARPFLQETSIHSVGHLSGSNGSCWNLFWMLLSVVLFTISSYQVYLDISQMNLNRYSYNVRRMREEERIYPEISVCNNHWISWVDLQRVQQLNMSKLELLTILAPLNVRMELDECPSPDLLESALSKLNLTSAENSLNIEEIVRKIVKPTKLPQDMSIYFRSNKEFGHLIMCKKIPGKDLELDAYTMVFFTRGLPITSMLGFGFSRPEIDSIERIYRAHPVYSIYVENVLVAQRSDDQLPVDKGIYIRANQQLECFPATVFEHNMLDFHLRNTTLDMMLFNKSLRMKINEIVFQDLLRFRVGFVSPSVEEKPDRRGLRCRQHNNTTHENGYDSFLKHHSNTDYFIDFLEYEPPALRLKLDIESRTFIEKTGGTFVDTQHKYSLELVEQKTAWTLTECVQVLSLSTFISNVGGTLGIWTRSSIVFFIYLAVCGVCGQVAD